MIRASLAQHPRAASGRRAWLALVGVAGLVATVPIFLRRTRGPQSSGLDLSVSSHPRELPNLRFADGQGTLTSLAAFHGRLVLLNVWATWCRPCREEMPTLDRLQATLGSPDFKVVALSIDQGGVAVVQAFFAQTGIRHLRQYVDTFGDATSSLGVGGIPLTLLIDRDGREIGRKIGPTAWDHPQMVQLIRGHLASVAPPSAAAQR